MDRVGAVTGRHHKTVQYVGHPEPEKVIVVMGSASETTEEACKVLNAQGERVGVMKVRLYRPWPARHFLEALPPSVKQVTVLDRTREDGALGNPLYLDVSTTLAEAGRLGEVSVLGGQFGLASKEYTPRHAKAVFDNMRAAAARTSSSSASPTTSRTRASRSGPISARSPTARSSASFGGLGPTARSARTSRRSV